VKKLNLNKNECTRGCSLSFLILNSSFLLGVFRAELSSFGASRGAAAVAGAQLRCFDIVHWRVALLILLVAAAPAGFVPARPHLRQALFPAAEQITQFIENTHFACSAFLKNGPAPVAEII
jgi:hypothetical protein